MLKLTVEVEQEEDGRWIADVVDFPGVMVYGSTPQRALHAAKALAFRVLADRIETGEDLDAVTFEQHESLVVSRKPAASWPFFSEWVGALTRS